ncbi:hypothetical protein D9758_015240 [Tetrapyrgos nigripes]|uniref:Uncharacterized protein n=1 Tax=Tetrapyrgos nigripes TaxID=182062 RepID=A0A8H5C463_9AGAR|nr:hypothetical protein D9758_015240 [Tetrapyrgos nigripes]
MASVSLSSTQQINTYAKRWEALVDSAFPTNDSPSNPLNIDTIQIISWNDYGESHYIGPIKGAQPTESEAWTSLGRGDGASWFPLTFYYTSAFKNGGQYPDEKLVIWSRTHSVQAQVGDPVGEVTGRELVEDTVWAITLLADPANVTFEVYAYTDTPSSSNDIISSRTFSVQAGLTKLAMPIGFLDGDGDGGGTEFECSRVARSASASRSGLVSESQDKDQDKDTQQNQDTTDTDTDTAINTDTLPLAFLFPLQTLQIPALPTPSNSTQTFSLPNHSLLPVSLHTSLPSSPPTPWITTSSTYPVTPTFDYGVITTGNQTTLRGKNIVVDDMDVYSDDPSGTGNGGTGGLGHVLQYKGNWGVLSPETFVLDNQTPISFAGTSISLYRTIPSSSSTASSTSSINDGNITLSYTLDSNSPINLTLPLRSNSDTPIPLSKFLELEFNPMYSEQKVNGTIHTLEVMIAEIRYIGDDTSEGASGSGSGVDSATVVTTYTADASSPSSSSSYYFVGTQIEGQSSDPNTNSNSNSKQFTDPKQLGGTQTHTPGFGLDFITCQAAYDDIASIPLFNARSKARVRV